MGDISDTLITDSEIESLIKEFIDSLEEDFNTANAITALQSLLKLININTRQNKTIDEYNQMLSAALYMTSILGLKVELEPMTQEDKTMYRDWQDARENKEFAKADILRDKLTERGIL